MVSFSICNTEQEPRATHWHWRIWTMSFAFASCSCQRPLLKASKQDFIKAAFQGSIQIQMNFFPLSRISESSFPREERGNIIRKGNYSYFTRGSRSTLVILYLVIFLTTVLWKAHKQKWQQTSMKYCALYIIKSCHEEEGNPWHLSTLPLLLTPRLLEGTVHKMLCKTKPFLVALQKAFMTRQESFISVGPCWLSWQNLRKSVTRPELSCGGGIKQSCSPFPSTS